MEDGKSFDASFIFDDPKILEFMEALRDYLENTPREELLRIWNEISDDTDDDCPTVEEVLEWNTPKNNVDTPENGDEKMGSDATNC